MAPKKGTKAESVAELNWKLDAILESQEEMKETMQRGMDRVYALELWRAKVEDTIKQGTKTDEGDWFMRNKLPITIFLGIVWLLLNFLLGGKASWPF